MSGTSTGALTRVATSSYANETSFKKGYVGGPGRPKGSRNRVQADLARLVVQAAGNTGFVVIKDGNPVPGERGTLGYLEWAALYHSKTFLSLLARVLPYHIVEAAREPYSHARIGDRGDKGAGLPPALMTMLLQAAPKPQLDLDEDPNPYGVIDVQAAPGTDTGGVKE